MASSGDALADPGLGLDYAMVVHGEQRFEHARPIRAGDVITAQTTISSIKAAGGLTMLHTETQLRTLAGEQVGTARSMLVERGSA